MLENIRLALRGIWSHKLRSILTMLGVIIGIASIIAIVSIVEGTNRKLQKSLIGAGNNVVNVTLMQDGWSYEYDMGLPEGVPTVSDSVVDTIRQIDGVISVTRYNTRMAYEGVYRGDQALSNGRVNGVEENFMSTMEFTTTEGRNFSEEDFHGGQKLAVIDTAAADKLFGNDDAVGEAIEINSEPFVIIGVVKSANAEEEEEYENINDYYNQAYSGTGMGNVYIPKSCWPIIYQYDEPETVGIKVASTELMNSVAEEASSDINMYLTSDTYSYGNESNDGADELKTLTNAIQMMLVGIASLSLLVGGIGVMNIMLVSVTERTSEIGLKKALGAKRRTILAQFLTESAVLTLLGGILGIVLGTLLAKGISVVTGLEFAVSVPWIIISVIFSMGIGVLFGAMPANQASKLSPIDALRRE
ncbi:MAG: ABC transporter permease [Lachnospiraceae bacterium]|nr:ABC transporter permease [Lachnospiraceae bacterium]